MKSVMKGNKQLRISDDRLEGYQTLGYVEIDPETGAPQSPPDVQDDKSIKKELSALKKENKVLSEQVSTLTARLAELSAPTAETEQ